jgi:hypothetical protein
MRRADRINRVLRIFQCPTNGVFLSMRIRNQPDLTEGAASDILPGLHMKKLMQTRTVATLSVMLVMAACLHATPLAAQSLEASPGHKVTTEYYAPSVTPAIYLINFLFLYIANPDVAANLPAYKAPIPQPVVDCLEQNPAGCPYAAFRHYFEDQAKLGGGNGECFWPDVCQELAKWESLGPRRFRQPEHLNEPMGKRRAEQLAHLLGITDSMILTEQEYRCFIGTPPRTPDQETIFRCIYNMTNSKGNALIPLSSYGLNVNDDGYIRSVCATNSPCLNINTLLEGPVQRIALECGFLAKLLRMQAETPFLQLIGDANRCQVSAGAACLVETACVGKAPGKSNAARCARWRLLQRDLPFSAIFNPSEIFAATRSASLP